MGLLNCTASTFDGGHWFWQQAFPELNLIFQVPERFLQIFKVGSIALESGPPKILDHIAEVETHVPDDFDALHTRRVKIVMLWVVDLFFAHISSTPIQLHAALPDVVA